MQTNNVQILVLDFGSQYTQLIARRLREYGIYTEIVPYFEKLDSIKAKNPRGIILSGGPASVYEEDAFKPDSAIFDLGIPILGICYGMQYIAHFFGGKVVKASKQEFGKALLNIIQTKQAKSSPITFQSINKNDIKNTESLVKIWKKSVCATHHFLDSKDLKSIKEEVRGALGQLDTLIIAKNDKKMIGFIGLKQAHIAMLFVKPKFFGKNIGKMLIKSALKFIKESKRISVDCNTQNTAVLGFYQNLGFTITSQDSLDSKNRPYPISHLQIDTKTLQKSLQSSPIATDCDNALFENIKQDSIVWMSHADKVEQIPQGFVELARSGNTHYCAIANIEKSIYALQFHPEVVHSECGAQILQNFAEKICKSKTDWNMQNFAKDMMRNLRQKVLGNAALVQTLGREATQETGQESPQEKRESTQEKQSTQQKPLHFLFTQADKKDFKSLDMKPPKNTLGYKCTLQGKIVALMCGYKDKDKGIIEHFRIDIANKHQAQGIKKSLLQHLRLGLDCEVLHIKDRDTAFYDKLGVPYTQKDGIVALSLSDITSPPVMITKRLVLREYSESDWEHLHKILGDDKVMRSWGGGFNETQSKEWLNAQLKHYRKFGFGMWAVVEKKSREIIGHVGLNTMDISLDSKDLSIVELGYLLRTVSQKQGYGIEAAMACADYAFYQLGIDNLYCLITEGHTNSINLAKKLNMQLLGVNGKEKYKTELVYGIDKPSWLDWQKDFNNAATSPADSIKTRCEWVKAKNAEDEKLYQDYHDNEWGVPLHDDRGLFELLILEGFQAGLSWLTILKRRETFKAAFDDFDYHKIAAYDEAKIESLMQDEGIIRNRAKIKAAISNAQAFIAVQEEFGSFDNYIWGFVNHQPIINHFASINKLPAKTELSGKISKDLQKRGFTFVGSAIVYAFMQAIGMVNDHTTTCFKYGGGHSALGNHSADVSTFSRDIAEDYSSSSLKSAKNYESTTANLRMLGQNMGGRGILDEKSPQQEEANEAYRDIRRSEATLRCGDLSSKDKPDSKVLCAVSGGVDSSVVAALLYRAIGEHLIPVFVDTGLLRKGEKEAVEAMFQENLKVPLIVVDASDIFLGKLRGITDPEQKRKIIGETFIEVFEKEAKKHNANGEIKFLAQGTLYPDVIESVSIKGPSKTIKSHHNVGGLPEWMKFELIEPLRELFKDEVRELGRELGMPESMLMRHPFPGPGLAIRIMGEVNKADLDILREADSIFIEELQRNGLYDKVWQAFCVLLNVRSVGVMGDNRTYDNTICVRAVEAIDGMTATFAHLPHDFLESVSNRIINEVEGINRVVYDITSKPPGTIEWE